MPSLEQATRQRLSEIRDIARSGVTEFTGRAIREGPSGAFVGRVGGLKPAYPELQSIPDSPKQIAEAIDKGKGRAFERVYAAVEGAMQKAGYQPARVRKAGRATIPPHAGKPYCALCREYHTKGQHRFHGKGSFHKTHLFGFSLGNPSPMTVDAARQVFAHLMKKARESKLTDKQHAQLRTASQIIRYERRRGHTGRLNPRKKKKTTWTLQRYTEIAGQPWYALQQRIGGKLIRQYNGYRHEMDDLARRLKVRPRLLRPTTEAKFFARKNPRGISRRKARLIVHEGEIKGFPLTARQRKFFGARSSGYPRRPRVNAGRRGRRGLLRMGKLVELRYYRDHGKRQGYYKHRFEDSSPTVYYDERRNTIIAR